MTDDIIYLTRPNLRRRAFSLIVCPECKGRHACRDCWRRFVPGSARPCSCCEDHRCKRCLGEGRVLDKPPRKKRKKTKNR